MRETEELAAALKFCTIFLATATTFTQEFDPTALGAFFQDLEQSFDRSLSAVAQFVGIAILILGFSNFFWCGSWQFRNLQLMVLTKVPIQNAYGRRPVLIASTLICCVSNIWRAVATSYQSELGACAMNGFGARASLIWGDSSRSAQSIGVETNLDTQQKDAEQPSAKNTASWLGKGYPSKKQSMLWQLEGSTRNSLWTVLVNFVTPWELFLFPIVELGPFVVSWSASGLLTATLTQSQVLARPPYFYSSQTIGFLNFGLFVGSMIGLATNGPLSDSISMRATNRHGGIREPEMRLPALKSTTSADNGSSRSNRGSNANSLILGFDIRTK
ncbi:MFS transporter [Aspergillus sp. HF37]|nr:MFS transporter [Aspergillus sp. HF37]